ncbi:cation:proton antiporter [Candidatus Njordibacter sp. Uisw_056]|jgi:Kef-type K+ transport system membrane component KefB|uniref:cation:proton antiporter domain-containing protein n=1 Tax=Candidatus Njordibacter sp. Uisw_056 TaxID=3230973 RepID=UPI003D5C2EBB|tara:strand:+ start:21491 stop:22678 length:1188 start_codon:yes stop_codon:yes gene_type:complete
MHTESVIFSFFLIFTGAALLATLSLYFRQPLLLAYIVLGAILGPFGLAWVVDTELLADVSHIGIIFLLFLIGLDMQPSHLFRMLRKGYMVAFISSLAFALLGFFVGYGFGFSMIDSLIIGASTMFSSTIIGIKLLPTTVLHHKQTGELVVGLLLLQDLLAIILLTLLTTLGQQFSEGLELSLNVDLLISLAALPLIMLAALGFVRWVLLPLIKRFDRFHEYIFLLALGWCLGLAELAHSIGLSAEIGAFIAGVSLASSVISQYIAINLKPIRDFFLVLFFFSIGASFNFPLMHSIWFQCLVLAVLVVTIKPIVFGWIIRPICNSKATSWEVGFRLGQTSEFSILIATLAASSMLISESASLLIQATAIITFVASSYLVVWNFKSPIAVKDHLRHD